MCMNSTECERLSAKIKEEDVPTPSQSNMMGATDSAREHMAERYELVVRLNEYSMTEDNR